MTDRAPFWAFGAKNSQTITCHLCSLKVHVFRIIFSSFVFASGCIFDHLSCLLPSRNCKCFFFFGGMTRAICLFLLMFLACKRLKVQVIFHFLTKSKKKTKKKMSFSLHTNSCVVLWEILEKSISKSTPVSPDWGQGFWESLLLFCECFEINKRFCLGSAQPASR